MEVTVVKQITDKEFVFRFADKTTSREVKATVFSADFRRKLDDLRRAKQPKELCQV